MKKILLSLLLITVLMVPTTVMAQDMEINGEQPADSALAENINSNSAVAEVNGEKITQAELKKQANINQLLQQLSQVDQQLVKILAESKAGNNVLKEYQKQQLDSIIDNILLEQKAEEEGISLSSQEKDEIYQKQKQAILDQNKMDEDQFLSVLEKQGYENETEYKNEFLNNPQLKVNKLIEEEIAADIEVSESELKEAYESNKEIFAQGKENVSFEKLKPQLKQMLKQQKKRKKIDNYLSDLRKDAEITKNI
ncbi:Foldase protein PrsA precursor [Halanaerobium saccharolyticum subsp. saccharolyticum DSM 6643]|uniref:peptidylprolyl isomerase n=1 Tax=Halanaerobium saccharolyticum subsp. saccharolyticum DSM 6643 TaxID=1293054 RepID=M5EFL0_9FIRM|nr:SurA N-terminal domain-containing protein [Halanaerobium saccharolyticum]CCU79983.1 Foldase protein PrsA precursor [Halanaerobium saccharolyticum subsp. saccharolyticum DSM 6643]